MKQTLHMSKSCNIWGKHLLKCNEYQLKIVSSLLSSFVGITRELNQKSLIYSHIIYTTSTSSTLNYILFMSLLYIYTIRITYCKHVS